MSAFKPYLACSASAGSGKTWQLSIRYLALLLQGVPAEEILTLTFTKKATTEMLERITNLLLDLHSDSRKSEREELINLLEISEKELLEISTKTREQFLRSSHKIMTIDAFFNQILKSFALNIGISPLYEIGKIDESEITEEFLKQIYSNNLSSDLVYLSSLLDRSIKNIFEFLEMLYDNKIKLDLYNDLTVKPADIEFAKEQVFDQFLKIKYIVDNCREASNSAIKAVNLNSAEEVVNSGWFKKESLSDYSYFKKCFEPSMDTLFSALKSSVKKWYKLKEIKSIQTLSKIYHLYEDRLLSIKKRRRVLDYKDITHLTHELLTKKLDGEFFYFKLDSKIKHILIDEFQDTSIVQFNIIRPLIEEFVSGMGTISRTNVKSFFYVGDEKQSIYRFRGGNPYLFSAVKDLYPNISSQQLDTNYRSYRFPIEFSNALFKDKYLNFPLQKAHKTKDGFVEVIQTEEVISGVIETIEKLLANGIAPEKIAILSFTNKDIAFCVESIKKHRPDLIVSTETTEKLININSIRSIIEAVKYIYFKNPLYKANFCALNSLDLMATDLDRFDIYIDKPAHEMVFNIVKTFGLYYENKIEILRFLEWCATLENIEEFIFGYRDLALERESSEKEGITAMTIHKSKGLEFDCVVVFDRLGTKRANYSQLIFDLEGVDLKTIAYRFNNREFVDDQYKKVLEREKNEKDRDDLNALYVALTRAKEALFVITKPKSSAFEILNIEPLTMGNFPISQNSITAIKEPENIEKIVDISLGTQDIATTKKDDQKNIEAINFGLATHYMLEILGDLKKESIKEAVYATKNRYARVADIDLIAKNVNNLLNDKSFAALIAGKKLSKEHSIKVDNELIRVDLMAEDSSEIVVIDFKTGMFNSEHYRQVKNYLEKITKLTQKKLRGFIVYLHENIVIKEVL